jgi:YD repeat-containing protein
VSLGVFHPRPFTTSSPSSIEGRSFTAYDAAGTTKYTYTAGGQLWTEDGPWANDTITNLSVNGLQRDLNLQQPTGLWTNQFTYGNAGRLATVTSRAGTFTSLYNEGNQRTNHTRTDNSFQRLSHDAIGHPTVAHQRVQPMSPREIEH